MEKQTFSSAVQLLLLLLSAMLVHRTLQMFAQRRATMYTSELVHSAGG